MSVQEHIVWTVEEYLAFERASEAKHEFLAGEIFAMAGASRNHNLITGNVVTRLNMQLDERPCEVYPTDIRVKINNTGLYYPDVSMVCGEPQFDDDHQDTLLNPTVMVEVLSPSTENYDRGKKFLHYRSLASLQAYVVIAQDSYQVELYTRQADQGWLLTDFNGAEAIVPLTAVDCTLALSDIYRKVSFEA